MSWGFAFIGSVLSVSNRWTGTVGVILLVLSGYLASGAWGINIPKMMSERWPNLYPPEKPK